MRMSEFIHRQIRMIRIHGQWLMRITLGNRYCQSLLDSKLTNDHLSIQKTQTEAYVCLLFNHDQRNGFHCLFDEFINERERAHDMCKLLEFFRDEWRYR